MLEPQKPQIILEQKRDELIHNLFQICDVLIQEKNWEKLKQIHKKIISIDPERWPIYIVLARHCLISRQYEMMPYYLTKALEINPSCAQAYYYRGEYYRLQSDFSKALNCYKWALCLDNRYAAAYYGRALCYVEFKEYDSALEDVVDAHAHSGDNIPLSFSIRELFNELSRQHLCAEPTSLNLHKCP